MCCLLKIRGLKMYLVQHQIVLNARLGTFEFVLYPKNRLAYWLQLA